MTTSRGRRIGGVALAVGLVACAAGAVARDKIGEAAPALPLRLIADVPLSGNATRFDYASLDGRRGILWLAHMGDGAIEAFDLRHERVTRTISLGASASVRGILAVGEVVYAAAQGLHQVVIVDAAGERAGAVGVGDPDGLAYDPGTQRVFVSDESGDRDVAIDTRTGRRVGDVPLGGQAGNTQYDPVTGHVIVGVQTRNELAELDPVRLVLLRRYPLPGCASSHSVVIDASQHAAYIGCQDNARLVRLDLRSGRVVASGGVGSGVDVLALDPGLGRLYAASESGIVSVYDVAGGRLARRAQAFLHANAHAVAVDPGTHRVYFPLQNVGGHPVLRVMEPR